ncbi:hypothetical protein [Methylobacterium oxalidis]|nr:hypothetical protein [Methylobacterium oxalidis]GJE31810.1 hypothetical protein LDDCCGHA_1990 [Methylobacterium oxalidis]
MRDAGMPLLCLLLVGGCMPPLSSTPPMTYAEASSQRSVIRPAGISTDQLLSMRQEQQIAALNRTVKQADPGACTLNAIAVSEVGVKGRSIWNASCRGTPLPPDYAVILPKKADETAHVLRCRNELTSSLKCSSF